MFHGALWQLDPLMFFHSVAFFKAFHPEVLEERHEELLTRGIVLLGKAQKPYERFYLTDALVFLSADEGPAGLLERADKIGGNRLKEIVEMEVGPYYNSEESLSRADYPGYWVDE